jgi:hypothetical protein
MSEIKGCNSVFRQHDRYHGAFFKANEHYLLVEEISTSSVQLNAFKKTIFSVL